ncbi:VOC family protein [Marinobacterium jannaschii]|uniref:VOC family protein n=1 Tax=Marinobacterium jannaschii TaxID=64970 RepID=UPI000B19D438|nr:VOC family protein [Marinobacterium jannaschii]
MQLSMQLGTFSISLTVRDLQASRSFYEKLGFSASCGDEAENWLIMQNGDQLIGLFQGMFERNMLTFNPGWDQQGNQLETFTDIRELHQRLSASDIPIEQDESCASEAGPASFIVTDPDGNPILIDQHR